MTKKTKSTTPKNLSLKKERVRALTPVDGKKLGDVAGGRPDQPSGMIACVDG